MLHLSPLHPDGSGSGSGSGSVSVSVSVSELSPDSNNDHLPLEYKEKNVHFVYVESEILPASPLYSLKMIQH